MNITQDNLTLDEVRALLRAWGREYGERSCDFEDIERDSPDVHPLARARQFAPGTKQAAMAERCQSRGGWERRRLMGAAAGLTDERSGAARLLPAWACDPIAGTATRPDLRTPMHVTAPAASPLVGVVQIIVMDLIDHESDRPYGLALQSRYCIRGAPADKLAWFIRTLGTRATVRAYHAILDQAVLVMQRRLNP